MVRKLSRNKWLIPNNRSWKALHAEKTFGKSHQSEKVVGMGLIPRHFSGRSTLSRNLYPSRSLFRGKNGKDPHFLRWPDPIIQREILTKQGTVSYFTSCPFLETWVQHPTLSLKRDLTVFASCPTYPNFYCPFVHIISKKMFALPIADSNFDPFA